MNKLIPSPHPTHTPILRQSLANSYWCLLGTLLYMLSSQFVLHAYPYLSSMILDIINTLHSQEVINAWV